MASSRALARDGMRATRAAPDVGGAFSLLYREFYPQLLRFCLRRIGDRAAAEDVAQETFIRVLLHMDRFDPARPLWPWLRTIAGHLAIDHLRKANREVPLEEHPDRISIEEAAPGDERAILSESLARVPRRQRIALALRYLDDWDPEEIGAFLGLGRSALDQLLFRARRRLRSEYRRLAGSVPVLLPFPMRRIRQTVERLMDRARGPSGLHPVTVRTLENVVSGMLAVGLVLGGTLGEAYQSDGSRGAPTDAAGWIHPNRLFGGDESSSTEGHRSHPREGEVGDREAGVPGIVGNLTDPNRDVRDPEDARIESIAISPHFARDHTIYAGGSADCRAKFCPPVLFRSRDGGATWRRLTASGLGVGKILLPPGYGTLDARIFAMGPTGLLVSDDGGGSFRPAAVAGPPHAVGSAAISPAFHTDDPVILIGAQTLMRYRDDLKLVEPVVSSAGPGPLEPAYAAGYPADDRFFAGGLRFDPELGRTVATIHRCRDAAICSQSDIVGIGEIPKLRLAPDDRTGNLLFAFVSRGLFFSEDGAAGFVRLDVPWRGLLWDLGVGPRGGTLLAAVRRESRSTRGGLYRSTDGGLSWDSAGSPLFALGARTVVISGERALVALDESGIACSADGGASWRRRCPAPG